jgi:aspartyl protease family protein
MYKIFIYILMLLPAISYAVNSIELTGLFGKKAALLLIDGEETLVKLGKPKRGITLIEVIGQDVLLDVDGRRQQISLSRQGGGAYKSPEVKTVRIASQQGGHYWVKGLVNGYSVDFVVDTGATTISMNSSMATRLGIDYKNGQPIKIATANGLSDAMRVSLQKVTIGEITQYNVAATVTLTDALSVVLLGNSFLSGVDMRTENGVLILESSF